MGHGAVGGRQPVAAPYNACKTFSTTNSGSFKMQTGVYTLGAGCRSSSIRGKHCAAVSTVSRDETDASTHRHLDIDDNRTIRIDSPGDGAPATTSRTALNEDKSVLVAQQLQIDSTLDQR